MISLIVPAYNERARIGGTLEEVFGFFRCRADGVEVIVAADGEDGTRELVTELARREPCLRVIGGAERRGKGRGVREGVLAARGETIGFVDADNKTPIAEFDKFEPYLRQGADIVIGSRGLPDSVIENSVPLHRSLGSTGFRWIMHAVTGLRDIRDTQCGFKFFSRRAALDLFSRARIDGYMFDIEILYLARRLSYPIVQVPVRWRYDGDTRLDLFSGNVRNLWDLCRIRCGEGG